MGMGKSYYVYILSNRKDGTLYVGITGDLVRRVHQHRTKAADGFTARYGISHLVYFESYDEVGLALQREKNLKHWIRAWKVALIEQGNPQWRDLYSEICS
jgi:putative endonuclease